MKPEAEELGLIKAPSEAPAPVQGQGDEHHCVFRKGPGQGLGHERRHEPGRLGSALEFQLLRQPLGTAAVAKGGEGAAGRAPGRLKTTGEGAQGEAAGGAEILRAWAGKAAELALWWQQPARPGIEVLPKVSHRSPGSSNP